MFGRRTKAVKERAAGSAEIAAALAQDPKFRRHLLAAAQHGALARRRAASRIGLAAVAARLAADEELRQELRDAAVSLQRAWERAERKRSHRLRNTLLVGALGGIAASVAVPRARSRLSGLAGGLARGVSAPRAISEAIEVEVPVSTAYNQWTQFEDFPLFMEGVEHVQQLDDTRLHWVAKVGGRTAEWDAKILEQHPDRQITWVSEDGKATRGTVVFEARGPAATLVSLSMSYRAEGLSETLGSAAGIDRRRVRGDLERFKELIEGRAAETGAWRGEVSEGRKETPSAS